MKQLKNYLFLLVIALCCNFNLMAQAPTNKNDIDALRAFYISTKGDLWTNNKNWFSKSNATWNGVTVNKDGRVTSLYFNGNNLDGNLPAELGNLTELTTLIIINSIKLTGEIPATISRLSKLNRIEFFSVGLSGNIPNEICNLQNLQTISIIYTSITGSIPNDFNKLINLSTLVLNGNSLSGQISAEIKKLTDLTNLKKLNLYQNQFEGSITSVIGNLTSLQTLNLGANRLNGPIPSQIGNLKDLLSLNLGENYNLSGSIPPELGLLTKLTELRLGNNNLTGSIPTDIGKLTNLTILDFNRNKLSGSIPPEIGNLTKLTDLYLNRNDFLSGPIPVELFNLTSLKILWLNQNKLSGQIPPEIDNLRNLTWLSLQLNQLTGSIPSEISRLNKLVTLYINNNQFTDLPSLASGTKDATVESNFFTFDDIIPNLSHINTYTPQGKVGHTRTDKVNIGSDYSIDLGIDPSLTTNIYKWYKDGNPYIITDVNHLDFKSIKLTDAAVYTCTITNPGVPLLTLTSNPITVIVGGINIKNQPISVTQCEGTNVSFSVVATGTTNLTYNWRKNGTPIANTNNAIFTINNTSTNDAGKYDVVITDAKNLSVISNLATLTVNQIPIVSTTEPRFDHIILCEQCAIDGFLKSTVEGTTYSWTVNANGVSGTYASNSHDNKTLTIQHLKATGTTPGTATYTVTPWAYGCSGNPIIIVVTVIPKLDMDPIKDITVCNGELVNTIGFTGIVPGTICKWKNDNPEIGLATEGTGPISFTAVNNDNKSEKAKITVTQLYESKFFPGWNCAGKGQTFIITVEPTNTIALTSAIGTDSQIISMNKPISDITYKTSGATDAIFSLLPAGVKGTSKNDKVTISGTPTIPGTYNYKVSLTGGCGNITATGKITVTPLLPCPDAIATPASDTVCYGGSTVIKLSSSIVGTTFSWKVKEEGTRGANAGSGSSIIAGIGAAGKELGKATYTVTPYANGCYGTPISVVIYARPFNSTTWGVNNSSICSGESTSLYFISQFPNTTISWTVDQLGVNGAKEGSVVSAGYAGGYSNSYQTLRATTDTIGTVKYKISSSWYGCDYIMTTPIIVRVFPQPTVKPIKDIISFNGATVKAINFSGSVSNTIYTWTNDKSGIGLADKGTGDIISFIAKNNDTEPITAHVTVIPNNINPKNGGTGNGQKGDVTCSGSPMTFSITVYPENSIPKPDVKANPVSQTICSGFNTDIALSSSFTGTTYSWSVVQSGVSGATNGSGSTIDQHLISLGATPGKATYWITPKANGVSGDSISVVITVNPTTGVPIFTSGATTVCQNAADETYTATAENSTSIEYSVLPATAGTINAATGLMNWDAAFSGTATITATSTGLCGTTSANRKVTVNPTPVITSAPSLQTILSGTTMLSATLGGNIVADGGSGITERGVVYSSSNPTPTIGEAGVTKAPNGSGIGSFKETIGSLTPSTIYYFQAYATNSVGTNYGGVQSFNTNSGLLLKWDDISNVPVNDATSVSDWNTYFDLPTNGTPFTSVVVNGNTLNLIGGSGITLKDYLFGSNSSANNLIEIEDVSGCIVGCGNGVFSDWENEETGCHSLVKIHLPNCVSLGNEVFTDCELLLDVLLPFDSYTSLGNNVFNQCTSLSGNITFNNVKSIGEGCFANCENVKAFNFPLLETVSESGFNQCFGATEFNLPNVKSIGHGGLVSCTGATKFNFPLLETIGNMVFTGANVTEFNFPALKTIGDGSLNRCPNVKSINLPLVKSIGYYSFESDVALETLYMPSLINLGPSVLSNNVFGDDISGGIIGRSISLTIPAALMTCNGGYPDGDIAYLQEHNSVVITNPSTLKSIGLDSGLVPSLKQNIKVSSNQTSVIVSKRLSGKEIQNFSAISTSIVDPNLQTVCVNSAITNITYQTEAATGVTVTNLPNGIDWAWASNILTIHGIPTVAGKFEYTVTLTGSGECTTSVTGTITVNFGNTIILSSSAETDQQEVCANAPITNITYTTSGATNAIVTELPAGVSAAWANNKVTISGTPTESGTFNYTVSLTGGCGNITASGSITVNPNPDITASPSIQTILSGTTTTTATLGGNITSDGGTSITSRGVVYSTTDETPTIGETGVTKAPNGNGSGSFSETIGSLTSGTTYYFQAYATNRAGTNYGGVLSFTTGIIDSGYGYLYNWYTTQPKVEVKYGYLYNGFVHQDLRRITSSDDWHVASQKLYDTDPPSDWSILMGYTGEGYAQGYAGNLKETGTVYWNSPNIGATNVSGFNARGSGWRWGDNFYGLGEQSVIGDGGGQYSWGGFTIMKNLNDILTHWGGFGNQGGAAIRLVKNSTTLINGQSGIYTGNDGKVYNTICIGTQEWLSCNLMETKYRNGDVIPEVTNNSTWASLTTGARCSYYNDESNAGSTASIAPVGWHVPTFNEGLTLIFNWDNPNDRGKAIADSNPIYWIGEDANNSSGFTAKPSGYRNYLGVFQQIGVWTYWFCSDIAMNGKIQNIELFNYLNPLTCDLQSGTWEKTSGFNIRLIKDDSTDPGILTDIDGNIYPTVKIGNQVWMAANLKVKHYNNGSVIPNVIDNAEWTALSTGAWCEYPGSSSSNLKSISIVNTSAVVTTVEQPETMNIKVYPNPTTGIVTIVGLQGNEISKISVYSSDGKLIEKKETKSTLATVDISKQAKGTYIIFINKKSIKVIKK